MSDNSLFDESAFTLIFQSCEIWRIISEKNVLTLSIEKYNYFKW